MIRTTSILCAAAACLPAADMTGLTCIAQEPQPYTVGVGGQAVFRCQPKADAGTTVTYAWKVDGKPAGTDQTLTVAAASQPGARTVSLVVQFTYKGVAWSTGKKVALTTVATDPPLQAATPVRTLEQGQSYAFTAVGRGLRWEYDIVGDAVSGYAPMTDPWCPSGYFDGLQTVSWTLPRGGPATATAWKTLNVRVTDANGRRLTMAFPMRRINEGGPVCNKDVFTPEQLLFWSGVPSTVPASQGVLANDWDSDEGEILTVSLVAAPKHGVLSLRPDGGFTYTAAPGFAGEDAFTYQASDGILKDTETATVLVLGPPGDLNRDGVVDARDLHVVTSQIQGP
jgi:hypothetical protein